MAREGNDSQQRSSSPSVEIIEVRGRAVVRDNRTAPSPQTQPQIRPTAPQRPPSPRPAGWDANMDAFERKDGQPNPIRNHVPMQRVTVANANLMTLFPTQYPGLDYPGSFAAGSPHGHPQPAAPAWLNRAAVAQGPGQTGPSTSLPAPSATNNTQSTPALPLSLRATPAASQGPGHAPLPASAQLPTTSSNAQLPATSGTTTALARYPGETTHETIQRQKGIDIDDASRYAAGTRAIPQDVQDLVDQIKGFNKNNLGYPVRVALKTLRDDFMSAGGKLRSGSILWNWYGDTRLFTRKEWYYLATEGRGEQIP